MNYKKYILTLSTFLLFISPFFITGYLIVKKQVLKYTYKERFENKIKETFSINLNDIVWIKKDKEILINHHIFDIKEINYLKNKIIVTGWFDEEEQEVDNHIAKKNSSKKEKTSIPIFSYLYYNEKLPHLFTRSCIDIKISYTLISYNEINKFFDCIIPPPKYLV